MVCAISPRSARRSLRALERLGHASSAVERRFVRLDHTEGVEHSGDLRAVVERAQRSRHASNVRTPASAPARESLPRRTGDEPSFRLDDATTSGRSRARRPPRSQRARRPVDPEQVRVLSRDPQHETPAVDLDLQVAVVMPPPSTSKRDPGRARRARPPPRTSPRIRSPFGSKSGSPAMTPPTHSPKIRPLPRRRHRARREIRVRDRLLDRVAVSTTRDATDQAIPDPHRPRPSAMARGSSSVRQRRSRAGSSASRRARATDEAAPC